MIDLTGYSPEALAEVERALERAKQGNAKPLAPRPPQLEDIREGMSKEQERAVCEAILKAIERP